MTSDGITDEDWDPIKESAAQICNHLLADRDELYNTESANMLDLLEKLTLKYGELPSIVATKADYVDDPDEELALLERALELAELRRDMYNIRLVTESLRDYYSISVVEKDKEQYWEGRLSQLPPPTE